MLTGLLSAQYVVVGALDLLFVVLAVSVLHQGQAWVGYLNAAYGIGAVAAGILTAHLLGWRLSQVIGTSVLVLGAGLVLTGFFHEAVVVVLLIGVVGAGRAVLFVAASTLLQRVVPAQGVGRVFGVVEGLSNLGLAVGSLLPALLIYLGGDRLAVVVVGGLLPAAAVLGVGALRRLDEGRTVPLGEVGLLRSSPRNATVTAIGPVTLFALGAASFLAVVGGHAATRHRAEDIAARRDNAEPKTQNAEPKTQNAEPKTDNAEA